MVKMIYGVRFRVGDVTKSLIEDTPWIDQGMEDILTWVSGRRTLERRSGHAGDAIYLCKIEATNEVEKASIFPNSRVGLREMDKFRTRKGTLIELLEKVYADAS